MTKKEIKLYQYRGLVKHLERLVEVDWALCVDEIAKNVWANRVYYAIVDLNEAFCPVVDVDLFLRAQGAFDSTLKICEQNKLSGTLVPKIF